MQENPGLGGSEIEYSIALSSINGGSLCGGIFALFISKNFFSYKTTMVLIPLLSAIGYTIYGLSVNSWMVIVGRFFSGVSGGLTLVIFMWYYVSSTEEYNTLQIKLDKAESTRLKRTLTVIFAVVTTFAYIPLSGNQSSKHYLVCILFVPALQLL